MSNCLFVQASSCSCFYGLCYLLIILTFTCRISQPRIITSLLTSIRHIKQPVYSRESQHTQDENLHHESEAIKRCSRLIPSRMVGRSRRHPKNTKIESLTQHTKTSRNQHDHLLLSHTPLSECLTCPRPSSNLHKCKNKQWQKCEYRQDCDCCSLNIFDDL